MGTDVEYSKLNTLITDADGIRAIEVYIYREAGEKEWTLEVVNHENTSWVWDTTFSTDADALAEVHHALDEIGMDVFYQPEEEEGE